jgi:acetolactate synthase I/II/III large subunit
METPERADRMVDVFLRYLRAEGATVVFGVPGGLLHPFFAAVAKAPDFRLVVTKHECGAAFMADGFARAGGTLAVCAGTSGPGATNLLTGVAVAYSDGVPMLVVTGQASSVSMGKGAAQETPPEDIDIVAMFKPITKYSAMIPGPNKLAHHLRRALRMALTERPGPVHLNVPVDFWEQPAIEDWFEPSTYRPATELFDRRAVSAASRRLLSAQRPVILVGSGAVTARAAEHVRSLAELLPARVATTPRAKGVFPESHPLSLGVMGLAGHAAARQAVLSDEVDVLLTVGASLNETTTLNWHPNFRPSETLIQIDIQVEHIGRNYPVDLALVGDAQTITIELIYHIHRLLRDGEQSRSQWRGVAPLVHEDAFYDSPELRQSSAVPVTPQRWRVDLGRVLPNDAIVFSDVGGHMLFNIHDLCITDGQRFVLNLGFGSMGHGTAAPIGAALACPNRPIISIIGDACFAMQGMELLTAVEYDLPVIWIVENNQMHGISWFGSQLVGDRQPLHAIRNRRPVDIASIARAMGLRAATIDAPDRIQGALLEALGAAVPTVIEVRVAADIPPPLGPRAQVIAGFRDR